MGLILSWLWGSRESADLLDVSVETQVTTSVDEPVSIPAQSEITAPQDKPVSIPAESEIHVVAKPVQTVDTEHEDKAAAGLHAEDSVVEVPVSEETVITADTEVAVETVTETVATEVESVAEAPVEVGEPSAEVVGETVVEAEAITVEAEHLEVHTDVTDITESVHGAPEPEEVAVDVHPKPEAEMVPVETAVPTEALVKPEPEQQSATMKEPTPSGCNMIKPVVESTSDPFAEDCVVTESAIGVEAAIAEEKIPEITTDAPEVLSETLEETNPAPEPVPLPKEIIHAQDEFMAQVETEIKKAQDEFMSQVETEVKKDLAMSGGLTVDTINGCLATTEVAIEG
ncbi:uncharacterized protein LOC127621065 isoform X3 [Xyrauchen texanus]|uniref:uncharacterized protein LOC127621065 isoform X3 n=1 Tax=Xyrauchen texanus TaxID=154827 RepID=UPI0022423FD0|nr:uncharacterized protein LOC127621065 isoform X3 [Xyrauchen texanus]